MIPGEIQTADGDLTLNQGREAEAPCGPAVEVEGRVRLGEVVMGADLHGPVPRVDHTEPRDRLAVVDPDRSVAEDHLARASRPSGPAHGMG